jgi:hypothetical protein
MRLIFVYVWTQMDDAVSESESFRLRRRHRWICCFAVCMTLATPFSSPCLGSPRPPILELGNLFGTSPMPRAPGGRSGRIYPHLRGEMAYSKYNTTN